MVTQVPCGGSLRNLDFCVLSHSGAFLPGREDTILTSQSVLRMPFRAGALRYPQPHPRRSVQASGHGVLSGCTSHDSGSWPNQLGSRSLRPSFL